MFRKYQGKWYSLIHLKLFGGKQITFLQVSEHCYKLPTCFVKYQLQYMLKALATCNFDLKELSQFLIRFPFHGKGSGGTPESISCTKICTAAEFALTRAHARRFFFSLDNRARKYIVSLSSGAVRWSQFICTPPTRLKIKPPFAN
jgi:hypothetical protein